MVGVSSVVEHGASRRNRACGRMTPLARILGVFQRQRPRHRCGCALLPLREPFGPSDGNLDAANRFRLHHGPTYRLILADNAGYTGAILRKGRSLCGSAPGGCAAASPASVAMWRAQASRRRPCYRSRTRHAGVVELVDTADLGSAGQKPWGFKSLRPHHFSAVIGRQGSSRDPACTAGPRERSE